MKKNSRILMYPLIMVMFLLVSISCSKKDEVNDSNKSQLELLTSHQWKYSSIKRDGAATALLDCEKDDHFSWSADGIWTQNPGLVLCYGNEKVTSGSYSLSVDLKTISYGGYESQYNIHADIVELTESKLVLTSTAESVFEKTYVPY
ncbi:MAG TPA: lipocalin family protein [Prolixibacteraceae bacterium]|nr:lipocalin family protein [Prolixibacteraceae bacterium]